MELLSRLYQVLRHVGDVDRWAALVSYVGHTPLYAILFLVIFAETGLVILPFLPGDSLLFAIGALGTQEQIGLNLPLVTGLLIVAAVLGDAVNYWIGYNVGPRIFRSDDAAHPTQPAPVDPALGYETPVRPAKRTLRSVLFNRHHLAKAQAFYDKYGGKTIILARFVPIVRTFAPFVAGVGKMSYARFFLYNVIGAILWVGLCVGAGVVLGKNAWVKKNFEVVIILIVLISVVPMIIEFWRARRKGGVDVVEATTIGKVPDQSAPDIRR